MTTFRTRLTEIAGIVVMLLTFGLVRLDHPRVPRVRKMGMFHRFLIGLLARFRGHRDGRSGIPGSADTKSPPELVKLKQQGDGILRRLAANWAEADARLNGQYNAILRERDLVEERLAELANDLREEKRCEAERRKTLDRKRREEEARTAEERWRIRSWVYNALLALIFLGEFPLNAVAFRLFGEAEVVTWVMTGGLAAVLVFCAHGLGIILRLKKMSFRDEVLAWLLGLFPIAVVAAVGIVREVYLKDLGDVTGGIGQLGSVGGTIIFALINLLIYLGAFVLSYLHHDPVFEGLERLEKSVKRARRSADRIQHHIDVGRRRMLWITAKADRWRSARVGWLRESRFQAWRHKDFFETFMQSYCAANRLSLEKRWDRLKRRAERAQARAKRRGDAIPAIPNRPTLPKVLEAWTDDTKVKMPVEFNEAHELTWDRAPIDPGAKVATVLAGGDGLQQEPRAKARRARSPKRRRARAASGNGTDADVVVSDGGGVDLTDVTTEAVHRAKPRAQNR
jgi:hypothetical protein